MSELGDHIGVSRTELQHQSFGDLVARAVDPHDPSLSVVAWPGRRIRSDLAPGDVLVRGGPERTALTAVIADPNASPSGARAGGVDGPWPGRYVGVVNFDNEDGRQKNLHRIAGPDGLMLPGTYILRAHAQEQAADAIEAQAQPIIRNGSSGPAVATAQVKLNTVHFSRIAHGQSGLEGCPLVLDGRFGRNTERAVIAFQRFAFPGDAREWDGVVGPRTWERLDALADRGPAPPLPDPPTPPDRWPPDPAPIVPVASFPLEPDRWAPILSAAASPDAVLRSGNAVRALIDGKETFLAMVDDITAARGQNDYIYLLGWDLFDDFELVPGNADTTGLKLLADASSRGVQVRVMLWDQPGWQNKAQVSRVDALAHGAAILDDLTANNTPMSTARLAAALIAARIEPKLIPLIIPLIANDLARLTGSHHQKVLIVKRGEALIGYCGGVDWNPNRISVTKANAGHPHHDAHCRVVGPSAWDLLETFVRRWRHHPTSAAKDAAEGPLIGAREPVPLPIAAPGRADAPFGGTTAVIVARTFNPARTVPGVGRERDIQALLSAAIAAARSFIYLEDQYLVDLDTADLLNAAIPRLNHVTILILGEKINTYIFGAEHRRDFIERVRRGLSPRDLAKVGVFQRSTDPRTPTFGKHTYVHAKTWVIDDELAVIGSANCNRRGYQHDSEVDAFIFDDAPVTPLVGVGRETVTLGETVMLRPTFAQQYRMRLWSEHLGMPSAALLDGVSSAAFWRAPPLNAQIAPFAHMLAPSATQSLRDVAAEALRFIIDPVS